MDVRVGLWRKLIAEELMLLNCGVGEDSWESFGLQGEPISPFYDNKLHWRTPFPIWNQSVVPCPILLILHLHIDISGDRQVVWYHYCLKNFPQFVVIYPIKGFSIDSEWEVDVFLKFSSFLNDPIDVGSLISSYSFLNPAWTSGSSQFTHCWSLTWRILSITLLACEINTIVR